MKCLGDQTPANNYGCFEILASLKICLTIYLMFDNFCFTLPSSILHQCVSEFYVLVYILRHPHRTTLLTYLEMLRKETENFDILKYSLPH